MNVKTYIDYTLLKPDLTFEQIDKVVFEAIINKYYSICIPPYFIDRVKRAVDEKDLVITTVIGFPNGFESYKGKVEEIKEAVSNGAKEMDAVLNLSAVKNNKWNYVENEIDSLTSICRLKNAKLKLIVENQLVTEEELDQIVKLCIKHNVDFIKTATGVNGKTSLEFIRSLKRLCGDDLLIKAAGGISTKEEAIAMIENGASRIGTSSLI
ncbi:deoxyribose-phosphate aldolase [Membranihabitans marinus]|uniref:deoxyribose-phosphate aldolase n=1 Tax=Membranihabitans marinus TaxID=1227546 RepID=UPI001F026B73|nr:deoxyribose-phosphate aldolase [Membranihabitans marinus]